MSIVEFRKVTKRFGKLLVLDEVDLAIEEKEVVVLIGPSGSGKSTLLRCINALEPINGGDLIVDKISVRESRQKIRLIRQEAGMVFQQFNLFPQMTALENVAFGPRRVRGLSRQEAREQALAMLAKVGLADRVHHYPSELSGGNPTKPATQLDSRKAWPRPISKNDVYMGWRTRAYGPVEISLCCSRISSVIDQFRPSSL